MSLAALARVLAPGGVIAIVDDMPEAAAAGSADLRVFTAGWRCPVLWDRAQYATALEQLALHVIVECDLPANCRPRTLRHNRSATHVDFTIGSAELDIDGVAPDGTVDPLMPRRMG